MSEKCNFGDQPNERLKDRLVVGAKELKNLAVIAQWENIGIRQKICSNWVGYNFPRAFRMCKTCQGINLEACPIHRWPVNAITVSANRLTDKYPFKNKECFNASVSDIIIESVDRMEVRK